MENNNPSILNEPRDISMLNQITNSLNSNSVSLPLSQDLMFVCNNLLLQANTEALVIAILNCVTAYIKKGIRCIYDMIRKGLLPQIICRVNPKESNPKVSLNIAILSRHILMEVFSHNEILQEPTIIVDYLYFVDNIFEFPLKEQKEMIKFTKAISQLYTSDKCVRSLVKISQLLTHFDQEIVEDAIQIIYNCISKGSFYLFKIIDPILAKNIAISLEIITNRNLVILLLLILNALCKTSYEYAQQVVELPVDFGVMIHNSGSSPTDIMINTILKIINHVFSYKTLRKSDDRNDKISKFAFYVQPVLIDLIKHNSGDLNLLLESLSVTFDVYIPIDQLNDVLDAITFSICARKEKLKVDTFYKKLVENEKIKEALIQYNNLNLPKQNIVANVTDYKSLNDASNLHLSAFVINDHLQSSILSFLRQLSSAEFIEKSLSNDVYLSFKESLLKIVENSQKMLLFNVSPSPTKTESFFVNNQITKSLIITITDQNGKTVNAEILHLLNLTMCEVLMNYMPNNAALRGPAGIFKQLPIDMIDNAMMYIRMTNLDGMLKGDAVSNDGKASMINHSLCYNSNLRFTSTESWGYYKFYMMRNQGKLYSVFDNMYHAFIAGNKNTMFEAIELPKETRRPTEDDFMNREDIAHKLKGEKCLINFDAFHESFSQAYPTVDLKRRAFDYYIKLNIPTIEQTLQTLKEIHRLFPNLTNNGCNVFVNEIIGWRLLEKFDFIKIFQSNIITSTFINFPFLFPLEQRLIFLRSTAMSHLESYYSLIDDVFMKTQNPVRAVQRMTLLIDKEKIFEEGLKVINLLSTSSIVFDVKFKDQTCLGKGPLQEFLRLFALELQRNSLDIWLSDSEDGNEFASRKEELGLFPSPRSVRRPDLFFTLGALCAKAIENGITLPLHFSPSFIKLLRNERIEIQDVSKAYSRSIQNREGLIGLPFTLPGREDVELRDGGREINTDDSSVDLYIELLKKVLTFNVFNESTTSQQPSLTPISSTAWRRSTTDSSSLPLEPSDSIDSNGSLLEIKDDFPDEIADFIERYSFECCASMFKEGFGRIIQWKAMDLFTAEEFCTIIEGDDDFSLNSLKENVSIGAGYNENSPQIIWLFQVVSEELSGEEKKLFARFLTGSDSFGVFGLRSLVPRLNISRSEKSEQALPTASTCSNSLKLPEYSSKEILKNKLLYAIYECKESFCL
ncbi:hypothetical protein M9Y10_036720 [Tritrichomonas musculus]|uniref:HECT domain-containing protein n=1 Tax=Tritrichomonas musculus TaxID=1915356 RepID=A0ABR2GVN4_9EUKA